MQFAPLYPLIYRLLQPTFPQCLWAGNVASRIVALTFDDGPHPQYTLPLLDVLDRYDISASFFWLGVCVARSPTIAQEVYRRGHWIGLHGYDHRSFLLMPEQELRRSLQQTAEVIAQTCQLSPTRLLDVRPPNGLFTPKVLDLLEQWNYRPVMWSVVPEDWATPGVTTVVERVMQQVCNGSVIVLHDGFFGGSDVVETADLLIQKLLQQGFQFVTIDQLWSTRLSTTA
jgi:peptidoglycan/xylan/chitin deacetylase (PgdA/CDA1 family)